MDSLYVEAKGIYIFLFCCCYNRVNIDDNTETFIHHR